jgi:hypothetical protein
MSKLRKQGFLSIRYSSQQKERLGLAACLATQRRHAGVDESPLALEFIEKGVDELLESANPRELAQARADLAERRRLDAARKAAKEQQPRTKGDRRQHGERRLKAVGA